MRILATILFAIASISAFPQANSVNVGAVRSRVTDSTTVVQPSGWGVLFYNVQKQKWQYKDGSGTYNLEPGATGMNCPPEFNEYPTSHTLTTGDFNECGVGVLRANFTASGNIEIPTNASQPILPGSVINVLAPDDTVTFTFAGGVTHTGDNLKTYGPGGAMSAVKVDDDHWDIVNGVGGGAALTDGNATTANGSAVDLGGTQTADVDIDADGNDFTIRNGPEESSNYVLKFVDDIGGGVSSGGFGADVLSMSTTDGEQFLLFADGIIQLWNTNGSGIQINDNSGVGSDIEMDNGDIRLEAGDQVSTISDRVTLNAVTSINLQIGGVNKLGLNSTGTLLVNGSAGTSGQVITSAGAGGTATWQTPSGGGGITNSAASDEIMMSNGTNAVPSGVFKGTNLGDLNLGGSTSGSSRKVAATGSASNVQLVLESKGTSGVAINPNGGNITIGENDGVLSYTDFEAVQRDAIQNETSATGTTVYDFTAGFFKKYYFFNSSTVAKQVLLPSAATVSGAVSYRYAPTITLGITVGPNNVTLTPSGSDTINGLSSYVISGAGGYTFVTIVPIQGGYFVVGEN